MSVESKIKELLGRVESQVSLQEGNLQEDERTTPPMQGSSQVAPQASNMFAPTTGKDKTIAPAGTGDINQPRQGGSQDSPHEDFDETDPANVDNMGAVYAKDINPTVGRASLQPKGPVGAAPNFQTVGDPTSAVNIQQGRGNVPVGEEVDLESIFGDDLTEEFKDKASAIFEAAVIARVNSEMDNIVSTLQEKFTADVEEYKEAMVEKIDGYMNYVVENWMKENELAIEQGLRTEIAEDFMSGLQVLFKEHYIEIPEEKYDVLSELQAKTEELAENLNDAISYNVELNKEVISLKREAIVEDMSRDLAATEASKLDKLLEGVEFDNESLYREKVAVIKENYFPKNTITESTKSVQTQQTLIEETDTSVSYDNSVVSTYAKALSRAKR
jgi:hypothetical protein